MSPRPMSDIFSHIVAVSKEFLDRHPLTSTSACDPSFSPQTLTIPLFILPQPQPLRLDVELGLDRHASDQLSSVYLKAAGQLKARYEKHFRRTCQSFIQAGSPSHRDMMRLHSVYASGYTERLKNCSEQVKSYGVRILHARQEPVVNVTNAHKSRRSFSQRAISILEQFFERNAFPSRLEKIGLAAKTDMKFSQVHIWFQNRRRRCRKEGKILKRADHVPTFPPEFESLMAGLPAASKAETYLTERGTECRTSYSVTDGLNPKAPPHAFPSAYPPACAYDPFPLGDAVHKFSAPWFRKPASTSIGHSPDIDMSQLAALFTKMTLVDETPRFGMSLPHESYTPSDSHHRLSNVLGFTVIAPRAPHPALIPTTAFLQPTHPSEAPTVQATPLNSAELNITYVQTPASVVQTKKLTYKRKVAPLPKRMPSSSCRGILPAVAAIYASPNIIPIVPLPHSPKIPDSLPKDAFSQQTSSRKVVALPKRAAAPPAVPYILPPSSLRFVAASCRTSSTSSSTSSGSNSPSEPDTPPSTPPFLPIALLPSKASASCTLGPTSSFSSLFREPSVDKLSLAEGLQLHVELAA